jgi:hypothetical protein
MESARFDSGSGDDGDVDSEGNENSLIAGEVWLLDLFLAPCGFWFSQGHREDQLVLSIDGR